MIHVGSFSTGIVSALMCERMIKRYGKENCLFVFMDTLIEDPDNYRYMADVEKYLGVEVVKLTEGRTPYQVFTDEHVIPSARFAPCTLRLKLKMFRAYIATLPKPLTVHIGYDVFELERCEPTRKNYEKLGYSVDFPMLWKPYEYRDYSVVMREEWGIEPPEMYRLGYTHANCGGRCVKQGQGDWLRTLINHTDRFAEVEAWENQMRQKQKDNNKRQYAIAKSRKGGTMRPLPLSELRARYEANPNQRLDLLDEQSTCVVCGIGG